MNKLTTKIVCLIVFSIILAVLTTVWILLFYKKYSWANWTSSSICYVVFLTIIPVAIFVAHKLVFKIIAILLILFAALFAGFEIRDYLKRVKLIKLRLKNEITIEELHKIERNYRCCGIYGPGEYTDIPDSCCGNVFDVYLCPYIHGCYESYYYWQSLIEAWRAIGDFVKFSLLLGLIFCCFSQSIKPKKDEDDEIEEDINNSTIDEEDLWLMEERRESIASEYDLFGANNEYQKTEKKTLKLSFVDDDISNLYGMNRQDIKQDSDKFESCCSDMKNGNIECSLAIPENCKEPIDSENPISSDANPEIDDESLSRNTDILSNKITEEIKEEEVAIEADKDMENIENEKNKSKNK